ncbi:WD repeat domain-containing protein [Colletotrichum paranaense]|uniref:WD repeat domain-containing protein n=1 Tax=Colletotrichum paranaense TaxID=1914294 RepID=A0ABQ9S9U9_9PEZI|nr:WD repeat domain-containing protein [Colletotrichum paranaense]KAK1531169.1 WD repeat domain-containing protein [Colletotrichum paranaense]
MAPAASQFELAQPPSDAISSLSYAPESPTRLLVSCWDKKIYLYDTHSGGEDAPGILIKAIEFRAPVLDVTFGATDNEAYAACLDHCVYKIDLETEEKQVIAQHGAPARCVVYSSEHSLLISASWDLTLQIHNAKSPSDTNITVQLPGKPHALAASPSKVVVAMTARLVNIYDLTNIPALFAEPGTHDIKPWQQRESSLKFLTRAISCMPNDAGYATSSIEGRVAVEWFEDSAESQARKYAFKCHRAAAPDGEGDIVYPVNAMTFHPVYGTFASGGGDGTVALWDAEAKRRMKQYQKFPDSVAALAFSKDGKYLAVGVCPGFETGMEDYSAEGKASVFIRELGETEAKGKGAK